MLNSTSIHPIFMKIRRRVILFESLALFKLHQDWMESETNTSGHESCPQTNEKMVLFPYIWIVKHIKRCILLKENTGKRIGWSCAAYFACFGAIVASPKRPWKYSDFSHTEAIILIFIPFGLLKSKNGRVIKTDITSDRFSFFLY